MKAKLLIVLAIILCAIVAKIWWDNRGFTPWMNNTLMEPYLATFGVKNANGKNYWDQGHWISALETRWKNGRPEMRLRIEKVPPHSHAWWYWWVNQDQASFDKHLNELADDQFTLVSYSCLQWPDGTKRYYGVWHKYMVENPGIFDYFAADGRLIRNPRK